MKPILLFLTILIAMPVQAEITAKPDSLGRGAFVIVQSVEVAASPNEAYDLMTGDISGWWDHSFSEKPKALYIEPKPGGHFMEIFDDSGDGALHATVHYAERGKMIRFTGPMGLSGRAVTNVVTWKFEANDAGGTRVTSEVHLSGEVNERFANMGDGVWKHFLVEQFKPFVEKKITERDSINK